MPDAVAAVAEVLGHRLGDADLLQTALTHASFDDGQSGARPNERLEFLGDALLGAAVAEALYRRHPEVDEGALSRARARLVSRSALARAMDSSGLLPYCRVGPQNRQPWAVSIRANLAEAILGAIYLDGGWAALQRAVERLLGEQVAALPREPAGDWKNLLQQWALASQQTLPDYHSQRSGGSDHQPEFTATVTVGDQQATATGSSRRKAETAAAQALFVQVSAPSTDAS